MNQTNKITIGKINSVILFNFQKHFFNKYTYLKPWGEVQDRTRASARSDCGIPLPLPLEDFTSLYDNKDQIVNTSLAYNII